MTVFPSPHDHLNPHSLGGHPLLLRVGLPGGDRWLRVHEGGRLELAHGDARHDRVVTPLPGRDLGLDLGRVRDRLRAALRPMDLVAARSPWGTYYPVQAFAGLDAPVVEGFLGVEYEMGVRVDVLGLDEGRAGDPRVLAAALEALTEQAPAR